jgi:hypothetical protein
MPPANQSEPDFTDADRRRAHHAGDGIAGAATGQVMNRTNLSRRTGEVDCHPARIVCSTSKPSNSGWPK